MEDFVGRRAELDQLTEHLDRARAGTPTTVLVEGDGGTGKSALLRHFGVAAADVSHVTVSADEAETSISYGVYDQLLARLRGARSVPAARPANGRGDLQQTGDLLLEELVAAAGAGVCLLVLDDAHLTDRPSLVAIGYALRRLRDEPVMTVLAVRPEHAGRVPVGLLRLVEDAHARIVLAGLSVSEVRDLAAAHGRSGLSERAAARLRDYTGGSPLHLTALLQEPDVGAGAWLAAPLRPPDAFARLVTAQLHETPVDARRLCEAAAVLGPRCDLRTAAAVAGVSEPLAGVDRLRTIGLVEIRQHPGADELAFRHGLIREAVLGGMQPTEAAALHLAAAGLTAGAESLFHRAAATPAFDPGLADELESLGARDAARGSWRTAADGFLSAARLSAPGTRRDAVLVRGIDALLVAGDLAVARTYTDELAALPATARGLQAQALMAWMAGEFTAAEELATRAWASAVDLEPPERDRLAGLLAQMYVLQGRGRAAVAWSQSALGSGLLSPRHRASTLATMVGGLWLDDRVDEAMAALPIEGDPNDAGFRELIGMRGIFTIFAGDVATGVAMLRIRLRPNLDDHARGQSPIELLTATGPDGIEPNKLIVLLCLAEAEYRRGNWDVSAAVAEQALALIEDTEQGWILPWASGVAALVPAARGDWTQAEHHVAIALDAAGRVGGELNVGFAHEAAVHLATCRHDPERVVAAAQWLLTEGSEFQQAPGLHRWPEHYVAALVTLGRDDEAERLLDRWEGVARQRAGLARLAALARVRGDLAARRRDLAVARDCYRLAADAGQDCSNALERALLHASRGSFRRRRGERRSAVDDLREAERRLVELGAKPYLDDVRAELAACGLESTTAATLPPAAAGLTPQELAVANLVLAGRSNREIAETLVLSPKTISYHLGHVYAKLRVRTRAQLAAAHRELGINVPAGAG